MIDYVEPRVDPRALDEVFYVDEADFAPNPRIGAVWMPRGEQTILPTPGMNHKSYAGGARMRAQ